MTARARHAARRWTSPAAPTRLRAAVRRRRHRRARSSPTSPTSATSPASPAAPAMLLVTDDALVFTTDGRYRTQAGEQLGAAGVDATHRDRRHRRAAARGARRARSTAGARVGLEAHARHLGAAARRSRESLAGHELVATEGLVERLRRVKEPGEVARIRAACAIADDALGGAAPDASPTARPSATSRSTLEVEMRRRGASGNSFDPIVAAGPERGEAARPPERPHASSAGELVVIDFGCIVDGYCSDMTRTVSVGDPGRRRAPRVGRRAREPVGRTRRGARRAPTARPSTARAATSSPPPVGPTRSCTAPATASASRSTRRPGWPRVPVIPWNPVRSSPSSPACTSPASAACASRTRWSSPPTAPIPSPHSRRNSSL